MRIMSGSIQDPEVEKRWLEVMLKMQGEDGLLYTPVVGRPWALPDNPQPFAGFDNIPKGGQFCTVIMMGRILGAFSIYAELDPDGPWRDAAIKLTDGLCRLAIIKGDKAYMPAYVVEPGQTFPDDVKPPKRFTAGTTSWIIQGLAQCGRMLDYTPALELAGKLVNYMVNDADWFDQEGRFLSDFLPEDYIGDFVDLATGDSGQKDPSIFMRMPIRSWLCWNISRQAVTVPISSGQKNATPMREMKGKHFWDGSRNGFLESLMPRHQKPARLRTWLPVH